MNGSMLATGGVALWRGALVAAFTGLVVGLSSYLQVSNDCPSGQMSAVRADQIERGAKQAGKSPAKALRKAQAGAKAKEKACVKKVQDQHSKAVLAGLLAFASALGVRGLGEGVYDARRQLRGDVGSSDVQAGSMGRSERAGERIALEERIEKLEERLDNE